MIFLISIYAHSTMWTMVCTMSLISGNSKPLKRESASQGAASAGRNDNSVLDERQERRIRRNSVRGDYNEKAEAAVRWKKLADRNAEQDEELRKLKSQVGYYHFCLSNMQNDIKDYESDYPNSTQDNDVNLQYLYGHLKKFQTKLLEAESRLRNAERKSSHKRSAAGSAAGSSAKKSKTKLTDYKWVRF